MCFLCKQLLNLTVFTPPTPHAPNPIRGIPKTWQKFAMTRGTVNKPTCSAGAGLAAPAAPVAEPGITSVHGCTCFCRPLEVFVTLFRDGHSKQTRWYFWWSLFLFWFLCHKSVAPFEILRWKLLRHVYCHCLEYFWVTRLFRTSSKAKNGAFPPEVRKYLSEFVSTIIIENRKH